MNNPIMPSKTQILIWLVIILVIINAVTIGTISYHNYRENQQRDNVVINTEGNMLNGRFFRQAVGFNEQQMNVFREANHRFRPLATSITYQVDSLKSEMFAELKLTKSDTLKLSSMSNQIGELHGKLKYETYQYYLTIKQVCNQEQQVQLENVFQPLFKNEGITTPPCQQGRGKGFRN